MYSSFPHHIVVQGQLAIQAGTIPTYLIMNLTLSPHGGRETEEEVFDHSTLPNSNKIMEHFPFLFRIESTDEGFYSGRDESYSQRGPERDERRFLCIYTPA